MKPKEYKSHPTSREDIELDRNQKMGSLALLLTNWVISLDLSLLFHKIEGLNEIIAKVP